MDSNKFYTIIAGRKDPVTVEYGTLNKSTGLPEANTQKGQIAVGKILLMNYSRVWARRVPEPNDPRVKVEKVTVSDPHYKGKLEFLTWGAEGGEVVEIRFLPHSNSLDKQYQDTVQKLTLNNERDVYVPLEQGLNDFDEKLQPLLVQFLKAHSYNKDSVSKDPSLVDYDFVEYSPSSRSQQREALIVARNAASEIVLGAKGNGEKLQVLAALFGLDQRAQNAVLYELLLDKAESDPTTFNNVIAEYKNMVAIVLHDAIEVGLVSVENKGTLEMMEGSKMKVLLSDIEGDTAIGVVEKAIAPEVYNAFLKIKSALTAYKKSLAN